MADDWLTLTCPYCKNKMQIRQEFAHMRGRCPDCAARIEPPRPLPPSLPLPLPTTWNDDAPLTLEEVEEEWPEPARPVRDEGPAFYGFGEPPAPPPPISPLDGLHPLLPPLTESESMAVMASPANKPVPDLPPQPAPYAVMGKADRPLDTPPEPEAKSNFSGKDMAWIQPPPLPPVPRWATVFGFPWRFDGARLWVILSFDAVLLMGAMMLAFFALPPIFVVLVVIVVTCTLGMWIASFTACHFLNILAETAGGNDVLPRSEAPFFEGLWKLGYLACIGFIAFLPAVFLVPLTPSELVICLWILPPALFPLVLLTGLACESWLEPVNREFWGRWLKRPQLIAAAAGFGLLALPMFALASFAVASVNPLLMIVAALLGSAFVLIDARLLGFIAWQLSGAQAKPRRPPPDRRNPGLGKVDGEEKWGVSDKKSSRKGKYRETLDDEDA